MASISLPARLCARTARGSRAFGDGKRLAGARARIRGRTCRLVLRSGRPAGRLTAVVPGLRASAASPGRCHTTASRRKLRLRFGVVAGGETLRVNVRPGQPPTSCGPSTAFQRSMNSSASSWERSARIARAIRAASRGCAVPEQHDLARGDLDDLQRVGALRVGEQRRGPAALADQQPVLAVGPHAAARLQVGVAVEHAPVGQPHRGHVAHAALGRRRGRGLEIGGHRAQLDALEDRRRVHLARRGGDQHVVRALTSARPPAKAWRNAASENATARPICLA